MVTINLPDPKVRADAILGYPVYSQGPHRTYAVPTTPAILTLPV
jgi:hypothetical protein